MAWKSAVFSIGVVVLVCASAGLAADRLVPSVYPTIQAGIDAAGPGDTVIVAPGIYTGAGNRDLDFGGKAITVTSQNPDDPAVVAATVIDCQSSGRGFYFHSGETSAAVVTGLTITNGYVDWGGAIYCESSSPTISKCILSSNTASEDGGAIQNDYCSPTVAGCTFAGNNGSWSGGGISNFFATPTVKSCIFSDNSGQSGGAIMNHESDASITNCTFSGNSAFNGGAVYNSVSAGAQVYNCILWGDSAGSSGPEIYGDCVVSYSDVQGGWAGTGNIDADPCFVNPAGDEYHLLAGSPCIDTGDPAYSPTPGDADIDGEPRVMGLRVDMGADELTAGPIPVIEVLPGTLEFSAELGGPNPAPQILSIRNVGLGTLHWQIAEDCTWLQVSPASGQSAGDTNEVSVSVDIAGLGAGEYDCEMTVSDPNAFNSPQMVDVSLVISVPIIELSPQVFEFSAPLGGPNPSPQILTIRNRGGGTLNWQLSEDCSWLSADPNSGSLTAEQAVPVALFGDISGLQAGQYDCELTISDPNAENSPQIVGVTLYVGVRMLHVPSEYSTIQAAIDAALDGDTVIIAEGTYTGAGNKNLDFLGKAITVRSVDPEDPCVVAATVIDCQSSGRAFYFHSGEDPDSVVSGLTIQNGRIAGYAGEAYGGGVLCEGASPTITNSRIIGCVAMGTGGDWGSGGGEHSAGGEPLLAF